jgi:hypothetical protein
VNRFRSIWAVDFEFIADVGERPLPVCLTARELRSGRLIRHWQDELDGRPPYPAGADSLFVAYFASAELGCHLALGWPLPVRILDLYVEFSNLTNGAPRSLGRGLIGALAHFGLDAMVGAEKDSMRQLVLRGGPWSRAERQAILDYCQQDIDALALCCHACCRRSSSDRATSSVHCCAAATQPLWHRWTTPASR